MSLTEHLNATNFSDSSQVLASDRQSPINAGSSLTYSHAFSEKSNQEDVHEKKSSFWLLTAFIASLLMAASVIIRGIVVEDESLLVTKGLISAAALTLGLCLIVGTQISRKCKGDQTPLAWTQPNRDEAGQPIEGTWRFRKSILAVFMLRGVLEFCSSTCILMTLKVAMDHNINQGLSTACLSVSGLMVALMSRVFYGERLNWILGSGMLLICVAIFFIGYFVSMPEEAATHIDTRIEGGSFTDSANKDMLEVLMWGMFAALSLSFEVIWIKWLLLRGVQGFQGGQISIFFDGLYGVILLIVLNVMGEGTQTVDGWIQIQIMISGALLSFAFILINYSVANGVASIAFAVANLCPAWHVVFNWLILKQAISSGQLTGVALAIIGSGLISLQEQILGYCNKGKDQAADDDDNYVRARGVKDE